MRIEEPRILRVQKDGNSPEECEDAAGTEQEGEELRIAVSDGATEAAFAKEWAEILTGGFTRRTKKGANLTRISGEELNRWLQARDREWEKAVPWDRIPWHGQRKTDEGSAATLLGIIINLRKEEWQALAVGDSCLLIAGKNRLNISFPIKHPREFGNTPTLVRSQRTGQDTAGRAEYLQRAMRASQGKLHEGDLIIAATDALAQWILEENRQGNRPWETLLNQTPETWKLWTAAQRKAKRLKNDDTTMVIARILPDSE